jgi:hypothetical protein
MRNVPAGFLVLVLALVGWLCGCKPASPTAAAPTPAPAQRIDLIFTYGSEKEDWIKTVTTDFNRGHAATASGKIIQVKPIPMGSGECIDTLLSGQVQAHLTSPASAAFIKPRQCAIPREDRKRPHWRHGEPGPLTRRNRHVETHGRGARLGPESHWLGGNSWRRSRPERLGRLWPSRMGPLPFRSHQPIA